MRNEGSQRSTPAPLACWRIHFLQQVKDGAGSIEGAVVEGQRPLVADPSVRFATDGADVERHRGGVEDAAGAADA